MPHIHADGLIKRFRSRASAGRGGAAWFVCAPCARGAALDWVSFSIRRESWWVPSIPTVPATITLKTLSASSSRTRAVRGSRARAVARAAPNVAQIGVVFGQRTQLCVGLARSGVVRAAPRDLPRSHAPITARRALDGPHAPRHRALAGDAGAPALARRADALRCSRSVGCCTRPRCCSSTSPTIRLDAVSKLAVRGFIQRLNQERGVTIILTTHDIDDIEALCQRVSCSVTAELSATARSTTCASASPASAADDRPPWTPHRCAIPGRACWAVRANGSSWRSTRRSSPLPNLSRASAPPMRSRDLFIENPPIQQIIAELYRSTRLPTRRARTRRCSARATACS